MGEITVSASPVSEASQVVLGERSSEHQGPSAWVEIAGRRLTNREFDLFQQLVFKESGIFLGEQKKALLIGRLNNRLRALQCKTFREYYEFIEKNPEELEQLLNCVSTNETHFFREKRHFEYLANELFPLWNQEAEEGRRAKRVRIWSAASSTGEEAYSLAMLLLDLLPIEQGWSHEILGTDISTKVLNRAMQGEWPIDKAAEIPQEYLKKFMLKGRGASEGRMRAGNEIRSLVEFRRFNLIGDHSGIDGHFDLIFCCNVLIYFQQETKSYVIEKLLDRLAPGGMLLLGHSESLNGLTQRAVTVRPCVYRIGTKPPRRGA